MTKRIHAASVYLGTCLLLVSIEGKTQRLVPVELQEENVEETTAEIRLSLRLMNGFEVEHDRPEGNQSGSEETEYGFFLKQARLKVRASLGEMFVANISAELADGLARTSLGDSIPDYDGLPYLRNAYLNIRFVDALQIRAGRFKRPFSRLENRSTSVLPFRGRGLSNTVIVEDADWGDRALGMMLWGKIKPIDVKWSAALTNPSWEARKENETKGVNAQARLSWSPFKWLSVGANGGYKFVTFSEQDFPNIHHSAVGGDVRIEVGNFYGAAEALVGQRRIADLSVIDPVTNEPVLRRRDPHALGITAYMNYDFELLRQLVLQPVVFFEFADSDLDYARTEAVRMILGANFLVGEVLRIMPQVKWVRPLGVVDAAWVDPVVRPVNPWENQETYYLMLSLQL